MKRWQGKVRGRGGGDEVEVDKGVEERRGRRQQE